jgi:ApaG protein
MAVSSPARQIGSDTTTQGVRVLVRPVFLPHQTSTNEGKYVWAYHVRLVNESARAVQLVSRRWEIVDADGALRLVEGEGVVGRQPVLGPRAHFEYTSSCALDTSWGTMQGTYRFVDDAGKEFDVAIGRFYLVPGDEGAKHTQHPTGI